MKNRSKKIMGYEGEALIVKYLRGKGDRLLAQNYTIRGGEVDIISYDPVRHILKFVEVKVRSSDCFGSALAQVSYFKMRAMSRAAMRFMESPEYCAISSNMITIRFDFCALQKKPDHSWKLTYFEGIQAGGYGEV